MATDPASATFPSSSRLTIVSSSSIARSKDSCVTSELVLSAMIGSGCGACQSRPSYRYCLTPHQRRDMGGRRLRQALEVVAALEDGDDAALRAHVGNRHDLARHPAEIRLDQ